MLPSIPALAFLIYLLVLLPWLALKSVQHLRLAGEGKAALPRQETIWINTLISQTLMLVFAWLVAGAIDVSLFHVAPLDAGDFAAGAAALAAYFALRAIARVLRTEAEQRKLLVYAIAPRTGRQWLLWSLTVVAASVAEEAAYRGVGMAILSFWLGNGVVAAAVLSLAFAVAHAPQGGKSMLVIIPMAIVMHVLVWLTGTLAIAIVVHAVYDFVAGYQISREARTFA
jgi:membrane protease YdiL (CAAX protease family)